MRYFYLLLITGLLILNACNDSNKQPAPKAPACVEFPSIDTVTNLRGIVKLVDTLVYISNYVDETTDLKYYPCIINPLYAKAGFPLHYSGIIRKRASDKNNFIELTEVEPILNETVITNYVGFARFKDSATIAANEKNGIIKDSKIENYKLKLLLDYSGCTKGRINYFSHYKTTQIAGNVKVYGFITSPYEPCANLFTLWYEIDVTDYKGNTLLIFDGVKTHEFIIPK